MIFLFLFGVIFIAIGIAFVIKRKYYQKQKRILSVVRDCKLTCKIYKVTVEFYTPQGIVQKSVFSNFPKPIGQKVEIYYNEKKEKVELAEEVYSNSIEGALLSLCCGCVLIWVAVSTMYISSAAEKVGGLDIYRNTEEGRLATKIAICSFVMLILLTSIYMAIIEPLMRSIRMKSNYITKGVIVGYNKHMERKKASNRFFHAVASPIYQFYENGAMVQLELNDDGTRAAAYFNGNPKKNEVGKEVTIVINPRTGMAYCKEHYRKNLVGPIVMFAIVLAIEIVLLILL